MDTLGTRVRAARQAVGISQECLARKASVALLTVASIETGRVKDPQSSTLDRIATALGTTSGELLRGPQ